MMQVLSMYPLTDAYRRRLEEHLGTSLRPRLVGEFRRPSLRETWKALGVLRAEPLVLASEDPTAQAVTALLITVGGLFGRGRLLLFDHELRETCPSRLRVPIGLWRVVFDSLRANLLNRRLLRELTRLEGRWKPVPWKGGSHVAYLKTNLWFGVKAGGSVGHVAGVINGLDDIQQSVQVFANEPQPMVRKSIPFVAIPTPSLCAYPSEMNLVRYHQEFLNSIRKSLRHEPPDWLYQRLSVANYSGAVFSHEAQIPLVVEYNGSEVWVARNWGRGLRNEAFALAAEEAMLRQATLVVTVSQVLGDELKERGLPEERIFVHPNCVDPSTFRPGLLSAKEIREKRGVLGIAEDALVVTFLGTFGPWHGVLFLAEALKRLYAEAPAWLEQHRVHFLLVGDGSQRIEVEGLLDGLPAITFTGLVPQHEAPAYLGISDIFLSPHVHTQTDLRFFGSPTKLFEYMAMGKPILASRLEQIGDILEPGLEARSGGAQGNETSILFEPGDQEAFLMGVKRLVEQPELRVQLGEKARAKVLAEYTWGHYAHMLLARLKELS